MGFPYVDLFLGLLVLYMIYSVWAGYDSRYPVLGALVVLVIAAIVDAAGDSGAANTLAIFVFFLLVAGVVLLLFDYIRESRAERVPRADPRTDVAGSSAEPPPHVR